jgi:hypothetical protein
MKNFYFALFMLLLLPANSRADDSNIDGFGNGIEAQLLAHKFDAIDATAAELRRTGARFTGSHSKLFHLSGALRSFAGEGCGCQSNNSKITYEQKSAALRQWLRERPQSLTARIALADLLISYAWTARTGAYASRIDPDRWRLYSDRLNLAADTLKGIDPKADPYLFLEWMKIAEGRPMPRNHLDAIYAAATHNYPTFFHIYPDRADRLQERWFGYPGELARYTNSLLTSPGGDDGQVAYTYVASRLAKQYYDEHEDIYTGTGLTWPLLKTAYEVRAKHYGALPADWGFLLYFAECANDRESARDAIRHLSGKWVGGPWHNKEEFDAVVGWAQAR